MSVCAKFQPPNMSRSSLKVCGGGGGGGGGVWWGGVVVHAKFRVQL